MPYSPLISKIRCHNPNRKGSKVANRNYITYIATREGVDISNVKDINDLLDNININKTELREDLIHNGADNDKYLYYMAKRPRSHGLFGNVDTSDLNKVASEVSNLTKQGKCIYRGIISLSQKDAETLEFTDKNNWNTYLKMVMPDVAKELGVSITNFTWVAAYHAEKTHPHVHYELWDNTNKVKSPFIHTSVQHKCRILLSNAAFNNEYENMIKEVYKSEREEFNNIRNKSRTIMTESFKELMDNMDLFIPGMKVNTLPDRIKMKEIESISQELNDLVNQLPLKGSTDYAYLDPNIKTQVNKISTILLERLDIKKELNNYLNAIEDGQKLIGKTKFEIKISKEKAEKDIYNRLGNIITKKAKELKKYEKAVDMTLNINKGEVPEREEENIGSQLDNTTINYTTFPNEMTEIDDMNLDTEEVEEPNYSYIADEGKFICDWSDNYKEALSYLYDTKIQDFQLAFKYLAIEAANNNVLAIHDLGKIYEKGLGREINLDNSNKYYSKALKGFLNIENVKPQKYIEYRIGKLYEAGKGTDINYEESVKWYQCSADQNYKYAQYSLGMMYLKEKGIDLNIGNKNYYQAEALRLFHLSAKQRNAYASFELGKMYEKGIATNVNMKTSYTHYKNAFNEFLIMADSREDDNLMYRIGKMYYVGCGVDKNEKKAIEYLEASGKLNNVNAQFLLAKIYMNSENPKIEESLKILNKLVDANNDMAQYSMGKIYLEGKYLGKNIEESLNLLNKSAVQGNQFAQYQLGKMYFQGIEIDKDIDKAIDYLKSSAEQNNEYAQYTLGKIYADKDNKEYNINEALSWYLKATEQGNQFAQYQLGKMYFQGIEIDKDIDKAIDYLKSSAEQNNEYAQYTLGKIYADKDNKEYNINEALSWYLKATEQGNQFAQYQLGKMYFQGIEIDKDIDKAIEFLKASADQNNEYAQYTLGKVYADKDGPKYNIAEALSWYLKAADQNNQFAQYQLGKMYLWGNGVEKNEELGRYWLNKSIEQGNTYALKALETYENYNAHIVPGVAYSVIKGAFNMLTEESNNELSKNDHAYRSRSKQAMKEEALRQKGHGNNQIEY